MREIGGTVQRIDDPLKPIVPFGFTTLFGQNTVLWKRLPDDLNNHFLRSDIRFGHKINGPLFTDIFQIAMKRPKNNPGLLGRPGGDTLD